MSGIALAGLVVAAAGTTFSFVQAGKSRNRARDASNMAQRSLDKAKARTEMNKYDKLAINKEVYKGQRDSLTAAAAQVTQAAAEGDQRGVGATAGKIQGAVTAAQQQVTAAQSADVQKLEMVKAAEDARLADERMKIDTGEATQLFDAASQERNNAALQTSQGVQGLVGVAQQGIGLAAEGVGNNSANRSYRQLGKAAEGKGGLQEVLMKSQIQGGTGFEMFKDMGANNPGYSDFMTKLQSGNVSDKWLKGQVSQFYSPLQMQNLRDELNK